MAQYRVEGETAFEPRSRRPKTSPQATEQQLVDLIVQLRAKLTHAGLDAGADTIGWHLRHTHRQTVSRATINRILARAGLVTAEPAKRPKSSYIRFQAAQPNQTWQSDVTHYRLTGPEGTPGADVEVISWLDDHSRFALHVSAHRHVTGSVVVATFRNAAAQHGYPASTLTDNGMVYTTRPSGGSIHGTGGRNAFEYELCQQPSTGCGPVRSLGRSDVTSPGLPMRHGGIQAAERGDGDDLCDVRQYDDRRCPSQGSRA